MDTVDWLLDSDPAIRWQAMRDLTDASPVEVAAERARIPHAGLGGEILARQIPDGSWRRADSPVWLPTLFTLLLLRATGIDRAEPAVESAVSRLEAGLRWDDQARGWELRGPEFGGKPFFEGEVEPCINGGVLALGGYFGRPSSSLARRLASEQLEDGGWNCEAPQSARSSFHTTICVLEGLLEYERAAGSSPEIAAARMRGEEYLLERGLFRRRSTARLRVRLSWSSRSLPAITTMCSAHSITSGRRMFSLTRGFAMPYSSSKAGGRRMVDGSLIALTTRRFRFRGVSRWVSQANGTRSGRCGCFVGTSDKGFRAEPGKETKLHCAPPDFWKRLRWPGESGQG